MEIPILVTERLNLRPFKKSDATVMHQIMSGQDVLKYFPGNPFLSLEQVQRMIERILDHWEKHFYGLWAVELSNGTLLGRCGLQYLPDTDEVEIDFIISPKYWGHGFATEAGKASLRYGFHLVSLKEVVGIVHPENVASQRVLQKIGMNFVEEAEYFGMPCHRYLAVAPVDNLNVSFSNPNTNELGESK